MRHSRPPVVVAHTVSYPPARHLGAELATQALLDHLVHSGWVAAVVQHADPPPDGRQVGNALVVPWSTGRTLRPDLVLTHLPVAVQAREHADARDVPLVVTVHGGPPGWTCARASAVEPDLLIANSQTMATSLERTGLPVHVLHPTVWPPEDDERGAGPAGAVGLVNAAPEKGGALLRELAEIMPEQRFVVIEGGYGQQVDYGDLGNVTVLPHGTPMWRFWHLVGVLVVPSAEESWGMAAVEAMMRGIPVIGSTAPGLVECLGGHGATLPLRDATLWANEVRTMQDGWRHRSRLAMQRAAELHPAPGLIGIERRLRELAGMGEDTAAEAPTMRTFRNVRTGQVAEVAEGSYMAKRLLARPEIWSAVEVTEVDLPEDEGPEASETESEGDEAPEVPIEPAIPPASNAPKAEWVEYAVKIGVEREAAEKATLATLKELYG